jgi:ferredoxin-NADP reductase/ferredoxin
LERALRIPALSAGWKGSLQAILDQEAAGAGGNAGLTGAAAPAPAWPGFRKLRVTRVDRESASVISLYFEPTDGSPLPAALPGQFLVLKLRVKPESPPLLRNYSISNAPGSHAYRVSVKQEVNGAGSSFLHDHVKAGDVLEVSAPRGSFTLGAGKEPVVLASAGIGATPVLAMLHALCVPGAVREFWWLYGARNGGEHPFAQEVRGLMQALGRGRSQIVYSKPESGDRQGVDYDSLGHLDMGVVERLGIGGDADYYLCGPTTFLREFTAGLQGRGVGAARIHEEIFGAMEAITPGIAAVARPPVHPPKGAVGLGPRVGFTRSGLTVPWNSSYASLLEFAEACDVPVRWSCRTGVCHMCESALIGGEVSYQPAPLEPPAAGNLLMCCSRPVGEVEIDL